MRKPSRLLMEVYGPQIQFSKRRDAQARGKASEADSRRASLSTWPAGLDPWWSFNCVAFPFALCLILLFVHRVWGL